MIICLSWLQVELLSTGGDLYEVIDPRDHAVVRAQMAVAGSNCGTETECLAGKSLSSIGIFEWKSVSVQTGLLISLDPRA